jgi:hypothetical protein
MESKRFDGLQGGIEDSMRMLMMLAIVGALALQGAAACAAQEPARTEEAALIGLVPGTDAIAGWALDGEALFYAGDNLWEYIDGSAESFLSFGFRGMVAQNYVSPAGKGLKVEIYEHESSLMAYGIYAQMRSPGVTIRDIGAEGFSDDYSLSFWKGRFFVRVAVFEKDPALQEALMAYGRAIAAKIPERGELPAEAAAFPVEGLVPHSICYLTSGVLGREKFPPAFVGVYKLGDEEAKLYLSTLPDSAAALDTFAWYTHGLTSFETSVHGSPGELVAGHGTDPFQGDVLAFSLGSYLGVVAGLKQPAEKGTDLMKGMVERLRALEADREKAARPK